MRGWVTDARGSLLNGWNVTVSASQFSTGGGSPSTLPTGSLTLATPPVPSTTVGNLSLPSGPGPACGADRLEARRKRSLPAALAAGLGQWTFTPLNAAGGDLLLKRSGRRRGGHIHEHHHDDARDRAIAARAGSARLLCVAAALAGLIGLLGPSAAGPADLGFSLATSGTGPYFAFDARSGTTVAGRVQVVSRSDRPNRLSSRRPMSGPPRPAVWTTVRARRAPARAG